MTTATTVAGRPLSAWSRGTRCGTRHALGPGRVGEPPLGALLIDRALLVPEGARERLTATVLAVAELRLPGVLGTVDLVAEAEEVWLITARPAAPSLADLLAAGGAGPEASGSGAGPGADGSADAGPVADGSAGAGGEGGAGPDAGSAASVLNETAQTLLALHAAGLAHGSLTADGVVIAPDGTALLAETAPSIALGDRRAGPAGSALRDDVTAWADLADTLGRAWAVAGTPAVGLFARCSALARSDGLAAGRAALVAGRAALPADFLRRTALRVAAAAAFADLAAPEPRGAVSLAKTRTPSATASRAPSQTLAPAQARVPAPAQAPVPPSAPAQAPAQAPVPAQHPVLPPAPAQAPAPIPAPEATAPVRGGQAPGRDDRVPRPAAPDGQSTVPGRGRRGGRPAAPDDAQATVLGRRNRTTDPDAVPVPAAPEGGGDGEILLRFGPGVPVGDQESLRALWRTPAPAPARGGRRRARYAATAALTAVAVVLWLLLRPDAGPAVKAAEVRAPAARLHCGQTADVIGVITTDGGGGPVTYRWLRSDGQASGELVRVARRGRPEITVHLRWTVRGPGLFRGTARLQVLHRKGGGSGAEPIEARGTFRYACP
ncbi:hypothetical protein ACWCP6_14250 [Streptomyces sp. NPDC002004]